MKTLTVTPRKTRTLRVLQFAYGCSLYGAERWILNLVKHLDPEKVTTYVACIEDAPGASLPLLVEAEARGLATLKLNGLENLVVSSCRELREAVRQHDIDVVHSHGTRQDLISVLARAGLSYKLLSTPHGWEAKGSLKVRFYDALNKWLFLFCDGVAPLSQGLVDSLKHIPIPRRKITLIPNSVDVGEIEAAPAKKGLLPGQQSADDLVIGYIGQLIPRKGIDSLIEALAALPRSDWCCLIFGDGPARGELEALVAERSLAGKIRFLGFSPERLEYMKRFDLFVLPSYLEGIPRALMEAMAAGVPSIASRIPGVTDLIEDGETGYLFPAGDAPALRDTIVDAAADRHRSARLASAARRRILERHSGEAMARAYEGLYERLCRGSR